MLSGPGDLPSLAQPPAATTTASAAAATATAAATTTTTAAARPPRPTAATTGAAVSWCGVIIRLTVADRIGFPPDKQCCVHRKVTWRSYVDLGGMCVLRPGVGSYPLIGKRLQSYH